MAATRLRPLWLLLIALAWGATMVLFTPSLDALAHRLGSWTGTDATDPAGALAAAVPWVLAGALLLGATLTWIVQVPAWHPWRDTWMAVTWTTLATAGSYLAVQYIDLGPMFGYYGHAAVDLRGTGMLYVFPAAVAALFALAGTVTALVAANRIWSTPAPLREERFGPRPGGPGRTDL